MPLPALKNLAKKHGVSKKTAEKKWKESKKIVGKQYSKDSPAYWGTVMKIAKAKIAKHGKSGKSKTNEVLTFTEYLQQV